MQQVIFGIHPIINLLKYNPLSCKRIFISKNRKHTTQIAELFYYIKKYDITTKKVCKTWLDKQTNNHVHQGIIAYITQKLYYHQNHITSLLTKITSPLILILDNITDPHNLGACIRSAVAAKVNIIILPKHSSAKINSVVTKISCGAIHMIPIIYVSNINNIIVLLKKYKINIIGADGHSNTIIYDYHLQYPICLIVGSENKGIRQSIKKQCDILCKIPLSEKINSLNVSVATGIFLFEIIRQKNFK
ncbi:23S rRNA (guanosine(2251)-2'-O)-methyltransferase RlmB [Enterobacteriaceae endosymbiont of Macroplea mutica]|uniref:23S rRNA (guanosine(2251)-2'-O)-methyltransferase RlmB n=1 Tax=Enterobacteriaceae endosymbiont of Macroplea mutica TaxID=2675791 RepID=UPI001448FB8F|nr:23S rRNA (guanosine(2251)-2'-O)-methyltransferase RlmB [Enterobacteriaceae endosymbiont of Macroplea mutica]QJC31207.1 23S rRNA (guanosine(2251)-2'-O)-methyltransferase RlmB [Enterobacteriaceae endosymbiont of Macroplea mutica]